jgi:cytochrome P450
LVRARGHELRIRNTEGSKAPPFDIDILDPRLYDDPWEAYRWLRHNAPIWWDERNDLYVISRHEDVSHISRHQELYSAAQGVRPKVVAPMSIISMDDPEHTRQRRLVSQGFTPRMVRQLSDHIRDLSNQIIDEISARGSCDFVDDIALHVPLIVIAELIGLDPGQRRDLYRWSDAMMAGDGHIDADDADDPVLLRAAEAGGEFAAMCTELIERRQSDGSTDAPDEFRIDRDHNPHLAFGIGTHYCLGANLARAEIMVVFEELFRRLRDIRAVDTDTLQRGDSTLVLALNRLPAVFTPETAVPAS